MSALDRLLQEEMQAESQLLDDPVSQDDDEESAELGRIVYRASFSEMEDRFVNYDTAQWLLISLLLVLAWGAGILMLLYLPVRRYIMRRDFRSRKLCVTDNAIVYKVARPAWFPCFGLNRTEKCLMLPLVTDVVIEQGCLQSAYGICSLRIEIAGKSKPSPSDDIQIQGLDNPTLFRKVVLIVASTLKDRKAFNSNGCLSSLHDNETPVEEFPHQISAGPSNPWACTGLSSWQMAVKEEASNNTPLANVLLEKLDEIRSSLKRIEVLIGDQQRN